MLRVIRPMFLIGLPGKVIKLQIMIGKRSLNFRVEGLGFKA